MNKNLSRRQMLPVVAEFQDKDPCQRATELLGLLQNLDSEYILPQSFEFEGSKVIKVQRKLQDISRMHLSVEKTLSMGLQLCKAAEAIVNQGYIHAAIQPNYVFRDAGRFYLGGIEDCYKGSEIHTKYISTMYCAPEQFDGIATERSMVFSIGAIMYQMLCPCNYPCSISDPTVTYLRGLIEDKKRRRPMKRLSGISNSDLMDIIMRACDMNEHKRYPSLAHMRAAIEKIHCSIESHTIIRDSVRLIPPRTEFSIYQNKCAAVVKDIITHSNLGNSLVFGDLIGCGGFGLVFSAKGRKSGKEYAVKCITSPTLDEGFFVNRPVKESLESIEKCLREVEIHEQFNNCECIVKLVAKEVITSHDRVVLAIVMDRLCDISSSNVNTPKQVACMALDICTALRSIHSEGYTHRDIKPQNILYSPSEQRFKLSDFGIARYLTETEYASAHGTSLYMAPEVKHGRYSNKVDIYSLGLSMYSLLNHDRVPFLPKYPDPISEADATAAVEKRIFYKQPIPVLSHVPRDLGLIISKSTMHDPSQRYQTIDDMADALTTFLEEC